LAGICISWANRLFNWRNFLCIAFVCTSKSTGKPLSIFEMVLAILRKVLLFAVKDFGIPLLSPVTTKISISLSGTLSQA
jgi:hypothetical protein